MKTQETLNKINFEKYDWTLSKIVTDAGYTYYTVLCQKQTPKARFFPYKVEYNYRYSTLDKAVDSMERDIAHRKLMSEHKKQKKEELRKVKENFINPYKVGQILCDSWGYDQTNVDYYQITKVLKKSVYIRPIGQIFVEATGPMAEYVKPHKDSFCGPEERKNIIVTEWCKTGYISFKHGGCSLVDENEKAYQSHYA